MIIILDYKERNIWSFFLYSSLFHITYVSFNLQCYLILMCSFKSAFKAQSLLKISKISFMLFSHLLIFIKADKQRSINTATSWLLYNYNDKNLACIIKKLREVSVFLKLLVDCIFIQFQECKKDYQHTGPGFLKEKSTRFLHIAFFCQTVGAW